MAQYAGRKASAKTILAAAREDGRQFVRCVHFELRVGAIARLLVRPPSSKVRHVPEARALHMLVGHFHYELSSYRLPGKILALTPPAHYAGHALSRFATPGPITPGPIPPGVTGERILAIGRQVIHQIPPHLLRKACANTDML